MFKEQLEIVKEAKKRLYIMIEHKESELKTALRENPTATLELFKEVEDYGRDEFRMVHLYADGTESDYSVINYYLTIDSGFSTDCIGYSTEGEVYENITYSRILKTFTAESLEYLYDYFVRNIERVKNGEALIID